MSKKERLYEFNRGNILSAAKILFIEKGILQTTVDDIAKKADCSKSTIYVYFKSKDEIFDCIVLEYFILLKDEISKAIQNTSEFPESFFAIGNAIAKFYNEHPFYMDSILGEVKFSEDETNSVLFQLFETGEQLMELIANYLKTCIANGHIRNDFASLVQTTFVLWGGVAGLVAMAHKKEKYIMYRMGTSKEEYIQNGFNFLLQSMLPQVK